MRYCLFRQSTNRRAISNNSKASTRKYAGTDSAVIRHHSYQVSQLILQNAVKLQCPNIIPPYDYLATIQIPFPKSNLHDGFVMNEIQF